VSYTGWRLKKYEKHHAQNAMLSHFIWSTILPLKMDRTHKKDSECGTLISKGTWRDFSSILIFCGAPLTIVISYRGFTPGRLMPVV
jgi:hypothetical protein